jgi:hypothetical protein
MKRALIRAVACLVVPIAGASAQSVGPRFGVEAAAFYRTLDGETLSGIAPGVGFDIQGRLTWPTWSVGLGWHRSGHRLDWIDKNMIISGVFVEPRYVFPGQGASRLYFVARGGWAAHRLEVGGSETKASGFIVGAGLGMAFALASAVDFNASAMWARPSFGDAEVDGQTIPDSNLKGTSVFLRAGLSFTFAGR